jgi:cytochrome P450
VHSETLAAAFPRSDVNLFADESLRDPFGDYRRLRDLGPVVKLARPDVYAVSRFDDVRDALRASDVLKSGEGVGFSDAFNSVKGNNVLQSDGDQHRRMREAVMRPLKPGHLDQARPQFKEMVAARIAELVNAGEFDAMEKLARFLPVEAIAHLVGLEPEGRERMLEWAAATFNLIGPDQDPNDLKSLGGARAYMQSLNAEKVRTESWASQLFQAAKEGAISGVEAIGAISAYIVPSLDTTIFAQGSLLLNLARNPDQWDKLRKRPELIQSAVLEGVRHSSVIRWFSRVAAADYRIADQVIPAGSRIMLLYGSANRDERHYPEPDRFNVERNPRDHLAWGRGEHMCAGLHLARMEMEVLLEALVESGCTPHAGAPVIGTNRGLYGLNALPYRLTR